MFNNIHIRRTNKDDAAIQFMPVPLSYGPKQKFIARIQEAPNLEAGRSTFAITLPRMGFEITSLTYDPERKLALLQPVRNTSKETFTSTPYNLGITLSLFVKNQEDGLQIIEQILPFFCPDFNVVINELPELGVKRNLQFVLTGVKPDIEYEGDMKTRNVIVWDLTFDVKMNFFGYVANSNLIKRVIQNIWIDSNLTDAHGVPDPNHTPEQLAGERITTSVDPFDATPDGSYTFVEEFDEILGATT